jgi:hypothetical protein
MSCYNRELEVLKGKNRKGDYPRHVASKLHRAFAIVAASDGFDTMQHQGYPRISRCDNSHLWVEAIVCDQGELDRLIARKIPGATIINSEISPSFADCRQS